MPPLIGSSPILDCAEAAEFEGHYFGGEPTREWPAMQAAGRGVAREFMRDARSAGLMIDREGSILVLVGKGHNGGDALIAAGSILAQTRWSIEVGFAFGQNQLRPLALRAWQELQQSPEGNRVRVVRRRDVQSGYLAVVDGVFGFQFRPPLSEAVRAWLSVANQAKVQLRAAVDLPSGLDEEGAFQADATYATGIFKRPLLTLPNAGRKRYVDLGFFDHEEDGTKDRVLTSQILDPLRRLRPTNTDKRTFGMLAVVGGSRSFPGAVGMTVAAALMSGVGNVMAFVPESIAPAFAARWPEAMWVGCPETEEGNLFMESGLFLRRNLARATGLVVGPGLGREPETLALVQDILRDVAMPVLFDADALQPDLIEVGEFPRIFTPHRGEFERIANGRSPKTMAAKSDRIIVLKGPMTEIHAGEVVYHSVGGGPMLARGGSGDMLAGLIGGRLAALPESPLLAAAQGVEWHSLAARRVAEISGETAVRTTAILHELNNVIRKEEI
ncbi:MAG: NAD(P)H-hydrate dehydratase [Synoicihabitans sp.]